MDEYKYLELFTASVVKSHKMQNLKANRYKKCPDTDEDVSINVGGKSFVARQRTMMTIPGSLLSDLTKASEFYNADKKEYRFDRSPTMFEEILEAHRTGELHCPRDVCPTKFKRELHFWRVPMHLLMPCCWKNFYENADDLNTLNNILQSRKQPASLNTVDISREAEYHINKSMARDLNCPPPKEITLSLRYKIWLLLEEPSSSSAAKIWCFFYIFLVLASVVIFILWLNPDFRVKPYLKTKSLHPEELEYLSLLYSDKVIAMISKDPHPVIFGLDCLLASTFFLESVILLLICPTRLSLLKSPNYIIKVIVCLAMMSAFIFDINRDLIENENTAQTYAFLKGFSLFRLLLIFRIQKLYASLQVVLLSLEKSCKELVLLGFVFTITVVIYGGMIYCVELDTDSYPNLRSSFWWALITMTTVGYGDFYPKNTTGYIVASFCALQGLIVIALPIAAIASVFASYYARHSDLDSHIAAIKLEQENQNQTDHSSATTIGNNEKSQ